MCGIVGSFKKNKLIKLVNLNKYRGNRAYSVSVYNTKNKEIVYTYKKEGEFNSKDLNSFNFDKKLYYIIHLQSPTKETKNIHPCIIEDSYLWHNGMILNKNLKELMKKYNEQDSWDTNIILQGILKEGFKSLNEIDGSFGCILYLNNEFFIFRNMIIPIFYDKDLDISSTVFEEGVILEYDKIFKINFEKRKLEYYNIIKNKHNPYDI